MSDLASIGKKSVTTEMKALRTAKKELRKAIRSHLSSLPQEHLDRQSRRVADLLHSLPEYECARTISVYLSMPQGELSTKLIVNNAFRQGKAVYVPYLYKLPSVESERPKSLMDMVSLDSEADYEALEPDAWGIPTPSQDSVVGRKRCLGTGQGDRCDSNELDLVVIPGVAFDYTIARLGHGKGFYDFFLQRYKQQHASKAGSSKMPFLVGLALEEQLLPEHDRIPMDATDWRLDALVVGNATVLRR